MGYRHSEPNKIQTPFADVSLTSRVTESREVFSPLSTCTSSFRRRSPEAADEREYGVPGQTRRFGRRMIVVQLYWQSRGLRFTANILFQRL